MAQAGKPEDDSPTDSKRGNTFNTRLIGRAIRRRPLLCCCVSLLGIGTGLGIWFFLPLPKLTGAAVFHLASQTPTVLERSAGGDGSFASYKQSQAALVKRRLTLNAALNQPGIRQLGILKGVTGDEINWLDQKLKVDTKADSEFMRITMEGNSESDLLKLLDAIVKAYLADVEERHNGERKRKRTQLETNLRNSKNELEKYQTRIDAIATLIGSKDGATLVAIDSLLQNELRDASRERSVIRDDLRYAESELEAHDLAIGFRPPVTREALTAVAGSGAGTIYSSKPSVSVEISVSSEAISEAIRDDPVMRSLEADVDAARKKLSEIEETFQKGVVAPSLTAARDRLKTAEATRDKFRSERRQGVENRLKEKQRLALESRRETLREAVHRLRRKLEISQGKIANIEERIGKTNRYRVELEGYKRQIEQTEKLHNTIGEEIERLKVELGAPVRITLAEEPYVVPGIEGNRRLKYSVMGVVAVLVMGIGGIVGWEAMGQRVMHSDEVASAIGVRLLGTLPPSYPGASEPQATAHNRAMVEAVDSARTMLLHGSGGPPKTILITSAVAQEGKTTLSGHFAISLARAGFRTLLIDGDLQAPSAHRVYDLPASPGLCELLRGECSSDEVVRVSPIPGLSVLTAGCWNLAARQGLVGEGWRRILQEMESRFDFIIVDTAPLLLVSDTLLLAREVDGVVLSVLLDVSQVSYLAEAVEKLRSIGVVISGAIVNGVWHKAYLPGYGQRQLGSSHDNPRNESGAAAPSATASDRGLNS